MPSTFKVKKENGRYFAGGNEYELLVGSRAQVLHGTAYRTTGRLVKKDLLRIVRKLKDGSINTRIVSKKKHDQAKREKRLEKAGYFTKKGQFGFVYRDPSKKKGTRKKP
jgi:hypothetical protein